MLYRARALFVFWGNWWEFGQRWENGRQRENAKAATMRGRNLQFLKRAWTA